MFAIRFTHVGSLLVALFTLSIGPVHAQFLRLGPVEFESSMRVDAIYTTNVEQERPSEAEAEREDFYGIWSYDIMAQSELSANLTLSANAGIGIEKHLNREDLDNANEPFADFGVEATMELGRYYLGGRALYTRSAESQDSEAREFIPGSIKKRDVSDETELALFSGYEYKWIMAQIEYAQTTERHDDEEFQINDEDEETLDWLISYQPAELLVITYEENHEKTELINVEDEAETGWEVDQTLTIRLDYLQNILRRPQLSYGIGIEKEDENGEEGEWELLHTFTITDEAQLTDVLSYRIGAIYTYEEQEESTDIALTYDGYLEHEISETIVQSFLASRTPVETFGSTEETEQTSFTYQFIKEDLFIYDLTFRFGIAHEINKPLAEGAVELEEETTTTYTSELEYRKDLSTRMERVVSYEYSDERSNTEDEDLVEHRVMLSYIFTF